MNIYIWTMIFAAGCISLTSGDTKKGKLSLKGLCNGIGCQFCAVDVVKEACSGVCKNCDAGKREDPVLDREPDAKGAKKKGNAKKKKSEKKKDAQKKKKEKAKKKKEAKKKKKAEEKKKKEAEKKKKADEEKKKKEAEKKKKEEEERKEKEEEEERKKKEEEEKKKEAEKKEKEEKERKQKEKEEKEEREKQMQRDEEKKNKEKESKSGEKVPRTAEGDKYADAKLKKCCQSDAPPCAKAGVCRYDVGLRDMVKAQQKGCSPFKHLPATIKCAADNHDNRKCCKNNGIPDACLKFCSDNPPQTVSQDDSECAFEFRTMVDCHRDGVTYD